jgi:Transposase and inactivated derivatives, IS30 family
LDSTTKCNFDNRKKGQDAVAYRLFNLTLKLLMSYTHLTQTERYQISVLKRAGHTQKEIAGLLGRSTSTISRELARNLGRRGYRPIQAQKMSDVRAQGSRNARKIAPEVWAAVIERLKAQHSPEQIAAFLPVSHEAIYQYIYADKWQGGHLHRELRCQKKRRKRYGSGQNRRGQIPDRRDISTRPASVERRNRIGHWEGDTIIGARQKQAIVTMVERKSGLTLLFKVTHKTSDAVAQGIMRMMAPIKKKVKTLTFDNGLEFARHAMIDQAIGCTSYFAEPYSSWQRGTNENTNGLIRQYLPKSRAFNNVTQRELDMIMERLNNRPRKRLGWKTPHEVFMRPFNRVALRT